MSNNKQLAGFDPTGLERAAQVLKSKAIIII